ncbi:protein starmaker-like [Hibiscus syriacus]|uniref:protein starmaker-like n=1 Tax=Hibiscus syriacus TaxID=106335 RepID=UPI0019229DA1|nr:protein starmaker-like [Hibiscus syriacus]
MTVDEVTAVPAVEEVRSSSSKVEIAAEEVQVKKNGNEDISNGIKGGTVREDNDGDGDYVFVNGNEEENGGLVESDLEKNGNGIDGRDQGVESVETDGEVKSKTDLVKDSREEDESCIEIVDQDKESMELCHVDAPVDEQNSVDLVRSGPVFAINAENGVPETATTDQNEVSESAEDVSDANNIGEHTGSEAAAVDSSDKQSDGEVKSKTDLVKDSREEDESCIEIVDQDKESMELCHVEAPVDEQNSVDLVRSGPVFAINAENGVPETATADQNEVSESAEDVSDANNIGEHTGSEAAAVDSSDKQSDEISSDSGPDVNGSANGVEANVLDFRSKGNEESEMVVADDSDYNVNGLANDSAKAPASVTYDVDSRSKENEGSETAVKRK